MSDHRPSQRIIGYAKKVIEDTEILTSMNIQANQDLIRAGKQIEKLELKLNWSESEKCDLEKVILKVCDLTERLVNSEHSTTCCSTDENTIELTKCTCCQVRYEINQIKQSVTTEKTVGSDKE